MSDGSDRRAFLKRGLALTTAAATTAAVPGGAAQGSSQAPPPPVVPDPLVLRALAEVVLPGELGEDGRERAVRAFERWLESYEPAFEMNHGYGTHEIVYGPAHPGPGWRAQLEALDVEARRRTGSGFAALSHDGRRPFVERELSGEDGDLPSPARARHVSLGLLAHWASSSEANDLVYRARIGRHVCRGLDDLGEAPPPFSGDGE